MHLGRRVMDGWDVGPDRDKLKYEVRPFRAKMDTYADLGIISQEILLPLAQVTDHDTHCSSTGSLTLFPQL